MYWTDCIALWFVFFKHIVRVYRYSGNLILFFFFAVSIQIIQETVVNFDQSLLGILQLASVRWPPVAYKLATLALGFQYYNTI